MCKKLYEYLDKYTIAIILVIGVVLIFCLSSVEKSNVKKYNNGYCPNCHNAYETRDFFEKADGAKERHFSCDKCNIAGTIKLSSIGE